MDYRPLSSSAHGIIQVRILEWVAISFSRDQTHISCIAGGFFTTEPPGKVKVKVAQSCPTLWDPMQCPWNSPGQNTGVGSLSLLQGIFPTQGSNPGLPHCRQILYQLSHKGSPCCTVGTCYLSALYIVGCRETSF